MNHDNSHLRKIYREELSEQELIEMALIDEREYEPGIYALVMEAAKLRGLEEKIQAIQAGIHQPHNAHPEPIPEDSQAPQEDTVQELPEGYIVTSDIITNAVTSVLSRHNIRNHEAIAAEISAEISRITENE